MYATLKEHNIKSDSGTGNTWDPVMIIVEGLRKLGPDATAEQLRQYISGLSDFAGINGIYNFQRYPERGLGAENSTMVRYDAQAKQWVWLAKPGGTPLLP